ncbi:MAG: hypothetical protein ACI9KE_001976, partial [Polyangiales bacterium]
TSDGIESTFAHQVPGVIEALSPWSAVAAIASTDGGFWRLDPEGPVFVYVPEEIRGAHVFCGDPGRDGQVAVANDSGLFERQAGEWFSVSPSEDMRFGSVDWVSDIDGACHSRRGAVWISDRVGSERQNLYRVDGTSLTTYELPAGTSGDPLVGAGYIAVPTGNRLLFSSELGPLLSDWTVVEFAAGTIDAAASAGQSIWVEVGEHLYRYDGDAWTEVELELEGDVVAIHAHAAGGAWIETDDQVCHVASGNIIRVRGLRPFEVFFNPTSDLLIQTPHLGSPNISVTIDGGEPRLGSDGEGGTLFDDLMMGQPGWHTLNVRLSDEPQRSIEYRVVAGDVSFNRDVAPVATEFCATAACHDGGDEAESIPLLTFEHWVDAAFQINERVGRGSMPQDAPDAWTPSHATTLVDWVQGGRQP